MVSTLHIVNVQYPTHNGVYTCTGINTISGSAMNEKATITVQVQGKFFSMKWWQMIGLGSCVLKLGNYTFTEKEYSVTVKH